MKILVTGAKGQLGMDLVPELIRRGHEVTGADLEEMDITDASAVERFVMDCRPDAVIHCAAWTAVDAAEDQPEKVRLVNAVGTENIAAVCGSLDIPMMYFSTDYVFSGDGERPWKPDDEPCPLSVYGRTKYEGELAVRKHVPVKHFILRTQWVYGAHGKNFVKTMLRLAEDHRQLRVVNDQIGSPTYTADMASLAADMIVTDRYGIYHFCNEGYCSWYDFAVQIFREAGRDVEVIPVSSEEYPAKARRPLNSRMDTSKLKEQGFSLMPSWQDALHRDLIELGVIEA